LLIVGGIPGLVNSGLAEQTNRSPRGGRSADTEHEIDKVILGTNLVSVNTTVTDSHDRVVIGLGKDRFEVYDNNVKQEIAHFADDDVPVSLGIIYDLSGSMKGRIGRSLDALKRFLDTSHQDDDFFLVGFNNRASLLQDFTSSTDRIIGHLRLVAPKGSTALYDAAYVAIEKIKQGRLPRKALLIISDGQDNNSRYSYRELRTLVKESGVLIYTIGITDPYTDSLAGFGRSVLEEMAQVTGGRAFFPAADDQAELVEICTRIALELRHQYAIGFYPSDVTGPARWHKIKIKINPPKGLGRLAVSYRDGYPSFNSPFKQK
jgi:Ca-activated chloride channel family protein